MQPLAQPPRKDDRSFDDWMFRLWKRIAATAGLAWALIDKTGSNITDIETRNHADLQNINTATYTHLSAAHATDLTDGGATTLHKHDHAAQDNLNSTNYTHLTAANATDLTDGGDSTLHYHASDRARANHTGNQSADTVTVLNAQNADYTTVKNVLDVSLSTGVMGTGLLVTDHGDGTVDVAAANIVLRDSDSDVAALTTYKAASANLALTDGQLNYIYAQYNAGSPNYFATTTERTDTNTNILVANVYRSGTTAYINNYVIVRSNDNIRRIALRFVQTTEFEHASGVMLSETGTRNIAITAGVMWACTNSIPISAFDSSAAGTFTYAYRNGSGGWTEQVGQTQINVTQYDDGSGTLQTLTANRYAVAWVYVEVEDDDIAVLYGQGDYNLAQANEATPPSSLPPRILAQGFLAGKIIVKKSASTFTSVESAFASSLGTSIVTDHEQLAGLLGGGANDHYHLTAAQATVVANTSGTNTGDQTAATVPNTPSGNIVATDVQAALNELDADIPLRIAEAVNSRMMMQGIRTTSATSGSSGLMSPDSPHWDVGVHDFSIRWKGSLVTYPPAVNSRIVSKREGASSPFTGFLLFFVTSDLVRLVLYRADAGTTFDVTFPSDVIDNSIVELIVSVVRETASTAGSVTFYVNKKLVGTVAITAASTFSLDNAASAYINGSDASRDALATYGFQLFNMPLTAAEVVTLGDSGMLSSLADAYQGDLNVSSCANGTFNTFSGASATGFSAAKTTAGTKHAGTADEIVWNLAKRYYAEFDLVINSGGSSLDVRAMTAIGGTNLSGLSTAVAGHNRLTITPTTQGTGVLDFAATDTIGNIDFGVSNLSIYRAGALVDYSSEGVQPWPGQWLDGGINKLHLIQPAATNGSATIRPMRTFEIRWVNTWAGTHEAQYIGGSNQNVLPDNAFIESITGVISGATIEDIIIGDGSATSRWVAITTALAAGTTRFTLANNVSDGTNKKMVVDPDANFTGSISFVVKGIIL